MYSIIIADGLTNDFCNLDPQFQNISLNIGIDEINRVWGEGEVGKSIYFISKGKTEITSNDGKNRHGTFEDGDYFGDLSLILNEKR
jgi:CRP-like cAMP-binding protein